MYKEILFNEDAREKITNGLNTVAKAVTTTLGPKGNNVIFEESSFPTITKDGVTVAQQVFLEDKFENMGVMLAREAAENTNREAGDGPQPLYSKVLTPTGFIKMRKIKVGDEICGTSGTTQKVMGVFPKGKKQILKIKFEDNRIVECCEDHLWKVITDSGVKKVLTTKKLLDDGLFRTKSNGEKQYKYFVPISKPEFIKTKLLLDPYLVGILLGDGSLSGKDSTEISLGSNKEHILDKIKLPEGLKLNISFVESKNYFRVKIIGKTKDGKTIRNILQEIGLFGTTSGNKFIPKQYLYSDIKSRKALLQGLSDTDGHINKRGLLEYGTISKQLHLDVLELFRGLGKATHSYLLERKPNSSYSSTSIYRITELKGNKYGNKIKEIIPTEKYVEMQCIKVSNSDSLYYTDNYILTHNTTTTIALLATMVNEANKFIATGMNPILLKRGMDKGLELVLEKLKSQVKPIDTAEKKLQIATISANNDAPIGELIHGVIDKIGIEGIVTVQTSNSLKTEVEYVNGTMVGHGFESHIFMNDRKRLAAVLENPTIIICTDEITSQDQLVPMVQRLVKQGKNKIVLFVNSIEGAGLAFLVQNYLMGKFTCVPVKMPAFGDYKRDLIYDLAALTNATVIGDNDAVRLKDVDVEHCGTCEHITISQTNTIVVGGQGDITERVEEIRTLMATEKDIYKTEKLKDRLGKITGSVANIKVGGASETEQTEIKYRVEDAINATKSAIQEGIVEGGGVALLKCSFDIEPTGVKEYDAGMEIVLESLKIPVIGIATNAGKNGETIVDKIKETGEGYDALTDEFCDLYEAGIIDPFKVVKQEIINSVATAGILITSSTAIAIKPEKV